MLMAQKKRGSGQGVKDAETKETGRYADAIALRTQKRCNRVSSGP